MSTPDVAEVAGGLGMVAHRLAFALRRPSAASDLTPSRYTTLATLERRGPMRAGDLAVALSITAASMSRLVDALLDGGWIRCDPDPADGRARLLSLSEHGEEVLERLRSEATSELAADIGDLPPDQQAALANALPVLVGLADRQLARLAQKR